MKKNDFIENIKKMFSRSDSEKKTDRIHGESAKDKYNNINKVKVDTIIFLIDLIDIFFKIRITLIKYM